MRESLLKNPHNNNYYAHFFCKLNKPKRKKLYVLITCKQHVENMCKVNE